MTFISTFIFLRSDGQQRRNYVKDTRMCSVELFLYLFRQSPYPINKRLELRVLDRFKSLGFG